MRINFWMDYASPFCYIAFHRLNEAIKTVGIDRNKLEYNFCTFQIAPTATENPRLTRGKMLTQKYGLTKQQLYERFQNITEQARDAGLTIDYADTLPINTMKALRLTKWSNDTQVNQKTAKLIDEIFVAYFVESQNIASDNVLLKIVNDAGLDASSAKKILTSEEYRDVVIEDEDNLANRNVDAVPYFEIGRYHYEGVPTKEDLIEAINNLIYQKAN